MSTWNLADIFELVAATLAGKAAVVQGDRTIAWRDFDRRANALAAEFLAGGLTRQAKVAVLLYNCPEYLETYFAAFKGALVPINTNYRYGAEELLYLWDNADAEAVVFHSCFGALIDGLRARLPQVKHWYAVADGSPIPDWARPYEDIVAQGRGSPPALPWKRSGDDLLLLYTGGTTGMPKGVMWRQDDLFNALGAGGNRIAGPDPVTSMAELEERLSTTDASPGIPACPLMHGTGQFSGFASMWMGRTIVCLENRNFRAAELWHTVAAYGVGSIAIVGDAFARPMLEFLDKNPGIYDLTSVESIASSGTMWSQEIKDGLLRHLPRAVLFDAFGSSEALGLGNSLAMAGTSVATAKFTPGETLRVLDAERRPVVPGGTGMVALSGWIPRGYYKDPKRTADTFVEIDGVHYSLPGDYARVEEDGTITLLGRGSVCINTGGEKVFPEEVEEVLKLHPEVLDALCVAVPDARFGQAICAVVEVSDPQSALELSELATWVRARLAAYKAPRHLRLVETIGRAPNGKADYRRHAAEAQAYLASGAVI